MTDERMEIEIEVDDETYRQLSAIAHALDITVEELIVRIIADAVGDRIDRIEETNDEEN